MEQLYEYFTRKLKETSTDFLRYKYPFIKWDVKAFGLVGPRGVGKSTMLLQHIKLHHSIDDTLYVSADHLYFSEHKLVDLADRFVKMGGHHLFIDEIHKAEIPGVAHPLPLFRSYLHNGYYPFGKDPEFDLEMLQVINQTMEVDIPQYLQTNVSIGRKLKSLLMVVARSVPFKPVMTKLAEVTGISRNDVSDYLIYIEQAGMISQLRDRTGGIRGLGKVEKLYLDNPNLIYVLEPDKADIGNVRETFFINQTRVTNDVISSKISDFEIDGRTFEIGGKNKGKNKGKKQIENAGEGYVVKDDIETGYANVIPIWAFGLLY